MRTRYCIAASLVAASIVSNSNADAQQRPSSSRPAAATPLPTPAITLPTPSNSNVAIAPLYLQREAVKRATNGQTSAAKPKRPGILASLEKTVEGDKPVIEAAKSVLGASARSLAQDGSATVIVVIGGEAELTRVVESLSRAERPIRVAYVDRSFEDATYDNTVLSSGIIGTVKDAADNMWVYLAKNGGLRQKPDRVLSTKAATATLWNGLFAADGDAVDVKQLKSLVAADSSKTSSPQAETAAPSSAAASAFAVGDVVTPRIASVKVLAEAKADSKVLGTVSKSDELVVAGAPKNGFVMVEGASVKGWVSVNLLSKQ